MSEQNKQTANVAVRIIKASESMEKPVQKSDVPTQVSLTEEKAASEWLEPPIDLLGLKEMVNQSSILPQCIRAYKNNIAGFGIGVRYKEDDEETDEMKTEWKKAVEIIELLNLDMDTKEIFEDIIDARETYGIAYLEVIRNASGEVASIEFIRDTPTIRKTKPLDPYLDTDFYYNGKIIKRPKRFCKYKQTVNEKTIYFKEFGDPRIMNKKDGKYVEDNKDGEKAEITNIQDQANEILEFAIGTEPYGEVRWMGQILGIDGSRRAEGLNNNYFKEGRHTPLLILIKNGTLTEDSFSKLQGYMNDIKGEKGQHAFMVLETEGADNGASYDPDTKPDIEIKDLASILQKDELFQDYLDNNRRKAQSAFQLPDLYVGYTTDFNRATAQTAQEVTEKQVFQPERRSVAWAINNKLLNEYQFKYVECYFKEPDITNPDDLYKMLTVCNNAKGLTPNKAKEIVYKIMGETSEDFTEEWGEIPFDFYQSQKTANNTLEQLTTQIQKAQSDNDVAVVAVMKEVRDLLSAQTQEV